MFKNKVAVITGGGGVLCAEFALMLAKEGAKVAVLDINKAAADKVSANINKAGGTAVGIECNVLSFESVSKAAEIVERQLGKCDFLINGAGGNNLKGTTDEETFREGTKSFFDLDPEGFRFVLDLNINGTVIPTQVFARHMIDKIGSSIINISSMSAPSPMTRVPAYSAAKAGISNFTQWLAVYFASSGIRVNAIAPGFLVTNQNRDLLLTKDGGLTGRGQKIISHTPMRRFGEPKELLGAIKFLLDYEQSAFITGVVLPIDGGFLAYSGV
ncbi:MAG TPA: SDR family oxidoreductase [Clostridia bacterium]|nr:SDR family oxidoreductase [Clostridia bacterium]